MQPSFYNESHNTSFKKDYLNCKTNEISNVLEKNRSYQSKLLDLKAKLVEERDQYNAMIKQFKEQKKIKIATRYLDSSPYIDFYKYDNIQNNMQGRVVHPKPNSLCLLRLMSGNKRVHNKYVKLQELISMNSETSMDSEDSSDDELNSNYVSSKNIDRSDSCNNKMFADKNSTHQLRRSSNHTSDYQNINESSDDYEDFENDNKNSDNKELYKGKLAEIEKKNYEYKKNQFLEKDFPQSTDPIYHQDYMKNLQNNFNLDHKNSTTKSNLQENYNSSLILNTNS